MRVVISLFLLFAGLQSLIAQNYFSAVVKDSLTGEVLAGATVMEKGTANGGTSDIDGKVKFIVSRTGDINFAVQYIGYKSKLLRFFIPLQEESISIYLMPSGEELDEVTVSSVRTNSKIEDIPTRVEVLGLDDLNEENGIKPGNIMSLLGDIAGIQMQQVSASSGNTTARIQGLNGRYTQLLKDGMPLFGGLSGNFGIMQIPPLDLKQIEIIKGSVSTLYGGDAIGGIINLVSKDPSEKPEFSVTLNQSTLLETNLNLYFSKKYKKIGFTLFSGETYQKEKDIDKDGLSDVTKVKNTVIHPKLVIYFSPKSSLTLNYAATFDNRIGGDMRFVRNEKNSDTLYHVSNEMRRHNVDCKWLYDFSKNNSLNVKASTSYLSQKLDTKAYPFDARQLIFFSELSYIHKSVATDWVGGLNFNVDYFDNQSPALSGVRGYKNSTLGAYIQNTWRATEKFTVESGFRTDFHSKYGVFPLPRLCLMYKFDKHFTARLNGGLGYKVPNFVNYVNLETDLNKITTNPSLNPEMSKGVNADVNYSRLFFEKLNVTVNQSFFLTDLSKPIYNGSIDSLSVFLKNGEKSLQTKGLQTYVRLQYEDFELYLGYVYTHIKKRYDVEHSLIPATPKHNFSSTAFYEYDKNLRFGIEASFIASQLSQDYQPVKNYFLFAAMIQYSYKKFTFVLNGENLLDFRQNRFEKIYDGTISNPSFHTLWAPIDGRVVNLSVRYSL